MAMGLLTMSDQERSRRVVSAGLKVLRVRSDTRPAWKTVARLTGCCCPDTHRARETWRPRHAGPQPVPIDKRWYPICDPKIFCSIVQDGTAGVIG